VFETDSFSHYLAFGSTDQHTMRELRNSYDGLIVPATVAAFQREGTGGFVLSLSALPDAPPYLIDPRFPLFQTALSEPKKSHAALAELLGQPERLIRAADPFPGDFDDELIRAIAARWVDFNLSYEERQAGKFAKYAERLDEEVEPDAAKGPSGIIAPYLVADNEQWWERSKRFHAATREAAPENVKVLRVVAAPSAAALGPLLSDVPDPEVIVWVSGLNELEVMPSQLVDYGRAVSASTARSQQCFALYGGFFSVLLACQGLRGSCHGIGYGEHRNWPQLSQSGPPPPRYYAPRFHRYINQDLAYQLWSRDADLTGCNCPICDNGPPVLSYHDLMKHSVFARRAEIEAWASLDLTDALTRLREEHARLEDDIEAIELPEPFERPTAQATRHLPGWISALEQLADD
jgi:hypothetical protein